MIVTVIITLANFGWITIDALNVNKVARSLEMAAPSAAGEGTGSIRNVGGGSGTYHHPTIVREARHAVNNVMNYVVGGGKIGGVLINIGLIGLIIYFRRKEKEKKEKADAESKISNT